MKLNLWCFALVSLLERGSIGLPPCSEDGTNHSYSLERVLQHTNERLLSMRTVYLKSFELCRCKTNRREKFTTPPPQKKPHLTLRTRGRP